MQYCAVCLMAKDENKYIREWAEYHLRLGFDALIVYDNNSAAPLSAELADLIALGRVHMHRQESLPGCWMNTQAAAYSDCMARYKDAYRWIAVIDGDEFIVLKNTMNIKEFLAEYECYGAVAGHWVLFGTGGLLQNETDSQIYSFIQADETESTTLKSIVQPRLVERFTGPHGPVLLPGHFAVSADHFPLEPEAYSAPFVDAGLLINHYFMRTREDYEAKARRYAASNLPFTLLAPAAEEAKYSRRDLRIIKFYEPLKELPIEKGEEFTPPESVAALGEASLALLEARDFTRLELYLCQAGLFFADEPLIWMFRAIASRIRGNTPRALHCIREAIKISGNSMLYFELARIYEAMGEAERARRAQAQAEYKKSVEDEFCA